MAANIWITPHVSFTLLGHGRLIFSVADFVTRNFGAVGRSVNKKKILVSQSPTFFPYRSFLICIGPSAMQIINRPWPYGTFWSKIKINLVFVYGIKPEVWGRVGPDPRAELQVDPARGPQAEGLGRPGALPKGLVWERYRKYITLCCITRTGEQSFVWGIISWLTGI